MHLVPDRSTAKTKGLAIATRGLCVWQRFYNRHFFALRTAGEKQWFTPAEEGGEQRDEDEKDTIVA